MQQQFVQPPPQPVVYVGCTHAPTHPLSLSVCVCVCVSVCVSFSHTHAHTHTHTHTHVRTRIHTLTYTHAHGSALVRSTNRLPVHLIAMLCVVGDAHRSPSLLTPPSSLSLSLSTHTHTLIHTHTHTCCFHVLRFLLSSMACGVLFCAAGAQTQLSAPSAGNRYPDRSATAVEASNKDAIIHPTLQLVQAVCRKLQSLTTSCVVRDVACHSPPCVPNALRCNHPSLAACRWHQSNDT